MSGRGGAGRGAASGRKEVGRSQDFVLFCSGAAPVSGQQRGSDQALTSARDMGRGTLHTGHVQGGSRWILSVRYPNCV